jgi:hypothetical protein
MQFKVGVPGGMPTLPFMWVGGMYLMAELPRIKFEIGFLSMLTLIFITLKLTHYIDWSWWWVLCPIWGFWALVIVVVGLVLFFMGVYEMGVLKDWW